MANYKYQKLNNNEINNIISKCYICVLGTSDCNFPYMIPMYFEYDNTHDKNFFILESKDTGLKIRNLYNNSKVCIFIQYNESDCYKSIIASGKAYLLEENNEDNLNMLKIKVIINEISGRAYYK